MTKISTHTLTWSVTRSSAGRPDRTEYFNSHAHVERDPSVSAEKSCSVYFNSHAHVERDAEPSAADLRRAHFNSHAHVERDVYASSDMFLFVISTHTLTWSVTRFVILKFTATTFQLTRSRGA